jgi:hypothetical protein
MNHTGQPAPVTDSDCAPAVSLTKRLLRWGTMAFGILWASPLTLFGLLLALPVLLWKGELRLVVGKMPALLVTGPAADQVLHRHPFGPMVAMAIGHIVIGESRGLTPKILVHELVHVRQAAQWGFLFPFVYLGASAWAALRGKDAYWHNVFEVAARKEEKLA